jgi:HD superfamily phosphohydrolase
VITIRDPVHGSIAITGAELPIVDSRVYQRLRGIKQLGFTDQAFPGATHTRYAHGIGAMDVATRMFDALFPESRGELSQACRARFRQVLRLAVLLHDVGHPPASHASEPSMPIRAALGLDRFTPDELLEQASHEDYTRAILVMSELRPLVDAALAPFGSVAEDVAHLVTGRYPERGSVFVEQGIDYFPLLSQIVSGELDADRMDYLQRDAFYAGVSYGKFDQPWLVENLEKHIEAGRAYLAIAHRAVFAFEDFLLSRYHMFVSVYYHYIPVGFDTMLVRFLTEAPQDFKLAADMEGYISMDDVALWSALRGSSNRWAQRIANRQGYKRILEVNADSGLADFEAIVQALEAEKLDMFTSRDRGVLSKYYGKATTIPIYVRNNALRQSVRVEEYSRIYERYSNATQLHRVYVHPDQAQRARSIMSAFTRQAT